MISFKFTQNLFFLDDEFLYQNEAGDILVYDCNLLSSKILLLNSQAVSLYWA